MSQISQLEPEYLGFIREQKYGTPKVFTKPHEYEELKAYFAGHGKFLKWCAPWGCACPCNLICWTILFPLAIVSCIREDSDPEKDAKDVHNLRYVLFPTMLVKLSKGADGVVKEKSIMNFLDENNLTQEVVENIDDISRYKKSHFQSYFEIVSKVFFRDGINGWVQSMMVPKLSGILVFGKRTRKVFTGGDRNNPNNYEMRPVPEMKIISPIGSAQVFSKEFQQTLRNIKTGEYDQSLVFNDVQTTPPENNPFMQ